MSVTCGVIRSCFDPAAGVVDPSLSWKDKVRLASTAAVADLSSVTVADFDGAGQGVTLVAGDRVLVKDTASIDGIEPGHQRRVIGAIPNSYSYRPLTAVTLFVDYRYGPTD